MDVHYESTEVCPFCGQELEFIERTYNDPDDIEELYFCRACKQEFDLFLDLL